MPTEWRVSWEVVTLFSRPDLFTENQFLGPISAIEEHDWSPAERVTKNEKQAHYQYNTLSQWAEAGSQAIRNVRLESRDPGEWHVVHV